jgi:hypothetical protein
MQGVRAAQLALPLSALLGQNMTAMRMVALEAAGRGFLETFRRAAIGFQLWHCALQLNFGFRIFSF